ncbi:MAG: Ni/Fe hydrogenase subunit alpha [Candidatus Bathyarchaeota archaeon]|nr:Ni/Fe hydrogenase subunit alpha [Candidatus Bathyarchaeota archaeon]
MKDMHIDVHYLTRVEGHANIVVNTSNGVIDELRLEIIEAPRFFESMLLGKSYYDVAQITCRICGICAVGHTLASLRGTEDALGITPSEQTVLLRKLILDAETIQSHVLHDYFLVAPDFFGVGSVLPLAASHPDVVKRALRLKKLANDMCVTIGGRPVHPISLVPGGFTHIPTASELLAIKQRILDAVPDLQATVDLFKTLPIPAFDNPTEYVALKSDVEYAFYDGDIASSDGWRVRPQEYLDRIKERVVQHSSCKHVGAVRPNFMVGALARFNLNYLQLHPMAAVAAKELGLTGPSTNSFMISVAQLVEAIHAAEDSLTIIDELLRRGLKDEPLAPPTRHGRGVGAVEVPRGLLIHDYTYDEQNRITANNLIIPTTMNMANIEFDMRDLVPRLLQADKSQSEITLALEMLTRAYDPCISCSVHMLHVTFV